MAALMVFIVFLIAIAVSVPIGVAMCLGTLFPQYFMNAGAPVDQLINFTLSGADSTPILAVPLFILGGVIMAEGGISKRLFNFFAYFMGHRHAALEQTHQLLVDLVDALAQFLQFAHILLPHVQIPNSSQIANAAAASMTGTARWTIQGS